MSCSRTLGCFEPSQRVLFGLSGNQEEEESGGLWKVGGVFDFAIFSEVLNSGEKTLNQDPLTLLQTCLN